MPVALIVGESLGDRFEAAVHDSPTIVVCAKRKEYRNCEAEAARISDAALTSMLYVFPIFTNRLYDLLNLMR